jgi:hypothetical protein
MGLEAFRRIQCGKESTRGTEVAGDTILAGTLTMTPQIEWHSPVDERNSLAEFRRSVAVAHNASLRFTGDASYEQILQFLAMTLKGGVTPSTPSGIVRDWTFTPSLTAANTQDSFTFEYGDNIDEWTSTFVVARSMELGFSMGEVVSLSADLFGRWADNKAAATGVGQPTINEVISDGARLSIDTTWANLGTTAFASELVGGSIRLNSGLTPVRYADGLDSDGRATFTTVAENKRSHSMDLDILTTANGVAQVHDAWRDNTDRAIRISFSAANNSIATSYNYYIEVDMFGRFTSDPELYGSRDGENLMRMTFTSFDDGQSTPHDVQVKVRTTPTGI